MPDWIEQQRKPLTNGRIREAIGQIPQLPTHPNGDMTADTSLSESQQQANHHQIPEPHPWLDRVWFTQHGFTIFRLEPLPPRIVRLHVTREALQSLKKVNNNIAQKCFMYPVYPNEDVPIAPPSE